MRDCSLAGQTFPQGVPLGQSVRSEQTSAPPTVFLSKRRGTVLDPTYRAVDILFNHFVGSALVLTGKLSMQSGDARAAEIQQLVVSDLPFNELRLRELFPANRATFHVKVRRRATLPDDCLETENGNHEQDNQEDNGKNGDNHFALKSWD